MIKSLHWDITRNCNLRCKHCYNAEKYFDTLSSSYISEEMDLEQCLHTVKSFFDAGFGHIHFLGGEPLASPIIFDVIEYAKSLNMIISINSNACLLDSDMQLKLIELGVDQFAASLDGCTALINDSIRGAGTYEKVVSNMSRLNLLKKQSNSSLQTALVFTLTKKNIDDLILLPSIADKLGVDLIVLTTFIESGQGQKNREFFSISFDEVCDAIERMVSKELKQFSIPIQIDMRPRFCQYLSTFHDAPVIYNEKNSMCCAGEDVWYLEANGNVHPCLIFQLESGKLALDNNIFIKEKINIDKNKISEVKFSQYWKTFLDTKHNFDTAKIPTCIDCRYVNECQPCFADYGDYTSPILECEWTKRKESFQFDVIANMRTNVVNGVQLNREDLTISRNNEIILIIEGEMSVEIWDLIVGGDTAIAIYNRLFEAYEVNEETLKYDIVSFIFTLKNYGAIEFEENVKFKRKNDLVCEQIDDEVIIFDTENEQFYEFDGIGSFVWGLIDNIDLNTISQKVCDEYDIEKETVFQDMNTFINELREKQLITAL